MDDLLYRMIFKRKSFHILSGQKKLTEEDLEAIEKTFYRLKPLVPDIRVKIKIVHRTETSCPRGEYCILMYSEPKGNYRQNLGYMGEQLDLWLASKNIGVCWYGLGKTQQTAYDNLEFVMMMIIEKVDENLFRKDMFKSKRKLLEEIWVGPQISGVSDIVRFAPSACNTQPWIVENSGEGLTVYRYKKPGKRGMMPVNKVTITNRLDIGIFLLFTELCLTHENLQFERTLFDDFCGDEEKTPVAFYRLTL